jgi:subtilase family serine protease
MAKSPSFCGLVVATVLALANVPVPTATPTALAQVATLPGNHSPAIETLGFRNPAPPDQVLAMRVAIRPTHGVELKRLLAEQQDRSSPLYHQWLQTGEFDSRFGPSPAIRMAISDWLQQQGFQILESPNDRFTIRFRGTVQQAQAAFRVTIRSSDGGAHFANMTDPSLPSQLAGAIASIDGLDNLGAGAGGMHFARGSGGRNPQAGPVHDAVFYNGQTGFGPDDFRTFYDEEPLLNRHVNGAGGGCIGLIEVGDYDPQGVTNFNQAFKLTSVDIIRVVSPDSDNPGIDARSDETMADLLYAHSIAPGATIKVYLTNPATYGGNLITATIDSLNTAVQHNSCSTLSISIESCGFSASFFTGALHTTYMQAAAQGQTVFVAEGDEGAAEFQVNSSSQCIVGTSRHVNELASDPFVTAIGGTQFNPTYNSAGNDVGFVPESVWNEGPEGAGGILGAGGGGMSIYFSKPDFQTIGTPADGARDVPDISMEAALTHPGAFSVFPTQSSGADVVCCFAGTSLGAPIWAGITTLIVEQRPQHTRIGTLNPVLYALGNELNSAATGIRNVTKGNNNFNGVTGFKAAAGYNRATGWGTPDIANFVNAYLSN